MILNLLFLQSFCQIAREVLDAAAQAIRPGVTTDEIDRVVHEATIAAGLYFPMLFSYITF